MASPVPGPVPCPIASLTWKVFGDEQSTSYLQQTSSIDEYRSACEIFHGRLAFAVRGLNVDDFRVIFLACLSPILKQDDEYKRAAALEAFEAAHDNMDRLLITRFLAHA